MTTEAASPDEMRHRMDEIWIGNNVGFLTRYWFTATEALQRVAATPKDFAEFRARDMASGHVAAIISSHLEHHNYSGVLLAYAMLDEFMLVLTEKLGRARGAPIGPRDLRDRGVKGFKKFVHQVCRLSPSDADIDWLFLEDFAEVRHAIIHANGNLSHLHDRRRFEEVVARHEPALSLKHDGVKLVVADAFVTTCLTHTKRTALTLNRLAAPHSRE